MAFFIHGKLTKVTCSFINLNKAIIADKLTTNLAAHYTRQADKFENLTPTAIG